MNSDLNPNPAAGPGARLVVGIDAGGTRTRAVLADADAGRTLGEGVAGPGNALTVPSAELAGHLAEAVASAVPTAERARVAAVVGGFAGAARSPDAEPGRARARAALTAALTRLGIGDAAVEVYSDIEAAFAGAPGRPADGLALVAGTGAVAARIEGRALVATCGGDGWLLGDDGGGFWIGREAVRAALRAADGRGRATALTAAVGQALGVPAPALPPTGSEPGTTSPDGGASTLPAECGVPGFPAGGGVSGSAREGGSRPLPADGGSGRLPGRGGSPAPGGDGGSGGFPGDGDVAPGNGRGSWPFLGDGVSGGFSGGGADPVSGPRGGLWASPRRAAYRAALLPAVMNRPPVRLADLAPLVPRAAAEQDAVAEAILQEAATHLAGTVAALGPRPGEVLVVTGGLVAPDGPLLRPLTERLAHLGLTITPVPDGRSGAVALARLLAARR
ncbi:BadF/BadG/BcrA/BcrD ATPase family protein [Streptomyces sp. NPDC051987]|uniref:BadF/BadG/BcrA/BcrD ATPase family protein n=1 Tax=Streptomyces sp. NPDC051987 TaxID=3155808 RepID=UPI00341652EB